jgi:SAM-dependent methyltransferase
LGPAVPIVGAPRDAGCRKTLAVITQKIAGVSAMKGRRLLDVGCGDGCFTVALSGGFEEVHGIDVQDEWLDKFRWRVRGEDRYNVHNMSASAMQFDDGYFDTLVSIETIEHIPDLSKAADEFHRVLRAGGQLVMTCPNRLFPFENHGIRMGNWVYPKRVPLITYLPPLHDRWSLARVFTVRTLDRIFTARGFVRKTVDYAWPTFEHGGNRFQPLLRPLFGLMRVLEDSPVRMFGTSIVIRYDKA